jgi:hypothetical protein
LPRSCQRASDRRRYYRSADPGRLVGAEASLGLSDPTLAAIPTQWRTLKLLYVTPSS